MTQDTKITPADADRLIAELTALVARASAAILSLPRSGIEVRNKADNSPVTAADEASEALILEGLGRLAPEVAVVSEEMASGAPPQRRGHTFFVIDPLDGTREFLAGRDEFTVNLAIVSGGVPIAGVIAAPARGLLWRGTSTRAERLVLESGVARTAQTIATRSWPAQDAIAAISRSHLDAATEAFLKRHRLSHRQQCGSALKFCQLAEGAADIYPRLSMTCEWDVAAGHALLAAAGGAVTAPDGAPLAYGREKDNFRVPAFIAYGDPAVAARLRL